MSYKVTLLVKCMVFAVFCAVGLCSCKDADEGFDGQAFGIPAEESSSKERMSAKDDTSEDSEYTDIRGIYVYVCGAVKNPGVYTVEDGARQIVAIEAAGGMLPEACADGLNLAALVSDGERIYVPTKEEADTWSNDGQPLGAGVNNGLVNINTAAKEELMTLPGIGETKAQRIIEYRETHGRFFDIEALKNVPGIKSGTYDALKEFITV